MDTMFDNLWFLPVLLVMCEVTGGVGEAAAAAAGGAPTCGLPVMEVSPRRLPVAPADARLAASGLMDLSEMSLGGPPTDVNDILSTSIAPAVVKIIFVFTQVYPQ